MVQSDGLRARLMRALHAEGQKRGLDHDGIRQACAVRFGVGSMSELSLGQMKELYRAWAGKNFVARKAKPLPVRGYGKAGEAELVSPEELETLERAFALRSWGSETKATFVRRQLKGRDQIRTRADFARVFRGVQAMNRRDGLETKNVSARA